MKHRKLYVAPFLFTLTVEYPADGPNSEFEKLLEEIVGVRGRREGSGYSFVDGMRDIEFGFKSRAVAVAAAKRVKKLSSRVRKLEVSVSGRIWP